MSPLFTYNGKLLVVDNKLATNERCCCDKCPCDGEGSADSGPQFAVSGLLFGGRKIASWFDTPFTGPDDLTPGCDQDELSFGGYGLAAIQQALAGAINCTFDGFAIKSGAVACFYEDEEQNILSAIAIGPVIVNNIVFENSIAGDGTPAKANIHPDYTTHWSSLNFITDASYIKICPHNGNDGNAPIIFKP